MQIRAGTPEDEPAITDRLLVPAYEEAEAVDPEYNALDEDGVAAADASRWLETDDSVLFVAADDGELIGYVSGFTVEAPSIYDRPKQLHIDGLYVIGSARREASALLDRIERWADDHLGVTVHAANETAAGLYDDRYELTFESYRHRLE